jgi:hypothetical protein
LGLAVMTRWNRPLSPEAVFGFVILLLAVASLVLAVLA